MASRPPPPPAVLGQRSAALPCRALAVAGDVQADDQKTPVLERAEVPREGWLYLAAEARLVVKDPRTSRETTFRGPARVKACVDLNEESWLASGTFESSSGTGETPGAEEWVATPLGVVRFGAAKLSVEVGVRDTRVRVASGPAYIWTADDVSGRNADGGQTTAIDADEGWLRLAAGAKTLSPTSPPARLTSARSALQSCISLAKTTRALASALLEADADPMTAMRQVATRRLARAACAVAGVRIALLDPSDAPSEVVGNLAASLKDAAALWRSLPLR
jgi:hypothetical protein